MNYFEFKGIKSSNFKSIIVNELPSIVKSSEKVARYTSSSRNGDVIMHTGYYENTIRQVKCTIKDMSEIDEILAWLHGSGEASFSNQNDRFYKSSIINQIPFERVISNFRTFVIEFECQPFGYLKEGKEKIIVNKGDTGYILSNIGNVASEPILNVVGTGDIQLYIGQEVCNLKSIENNITINTPLMEVYKGVEVQNRKMKGKFPVLPIGAYSFRWTGNVTSVEIIPNWRCR